MENIEQYLKETEFLNFNDPSFAEYVGEIITLTDPVAQAIKFYNNVRDRFLYDPYHLDLRPESLVASKILTKNRAWCVEKAIVFAAGARKLGIPSRMGYAVVRNHIGVEKLEKYLKRTEIVFHGYVEVFLNNQWIACTPAFDKRICRISGVPPLEFDGKTDSMFQAYSGEKQFMEYLHYYGTFDDVPVDLMNTEMRRYYPHLFDEVWDEKGFSFYHL
ncbi:MAG: transglutaminase-like domain-containing protein [Flavobacteriales bacterium]|nr:transglutaminase-like domain-containing protein [Crocinitomicaceae bacterium]